MKFINHEKKNATIFQEGTSVSWIYFSESELHYALVYLTTHSNKYNS